MAKKHRKAPRADENAPLAAAGPILSRKGKKVIAAGAALLAAGFGLLTLTDPYGRNWASLAAPLAILSAYGIILAGILLPPEPDSPPEPGRTKEEPGPQQPQTPPGAQAGA